MNAPGDSSAGALFTDRHGPGGFHPEPRAGMALGMPRRHFRSVDSTNRVARELAAAGAAHGTLVTAGEQSAGKGRQGREWSAPLGSLLMSLVMRDPPPLLSLVAGVAVAETVDALRAAGPAPATGPAQIKWPNDVMVGDRKLAGILVEGRPQQLWAVLGIGINVAVPIGALPPELHDRAATLGLEHGAVEAVMQRLLCTLEDALCRPSGEILASLAARDYLRGRQISWQSAGVRLTGIATGVDPAGGLRARTVGGESVVLEAGEVHLGS